MVGTLIPSACHHALLVSGFSFCDCLCDNIVIFISFHLFCVHEFGCKCMLYVGTLKDSLQDLIFAFHHEGPEYQTLKPSGLETASSLADASPQPVEFGVCLFNAGSDISTVIVNSLCSQELLSS